MKGPLFHVAAKFLLAGPFWAEARVEANFGRGLQGGLFHVAAKFLLEDPLGGSTRRGEFGCGPEGSALPRGSEVFAAKSFGAKARVKANLDAALKGPLFHEAARFRCRSVWLNLVLR